MKNKKMYLITAYMMLMLVTLILVFNNQALAVEPKVENNDNNRLTTNINTDKTIFKAKVKYKKFPKSTESNPIIRREVLVGLTKNGVDLGKDYEKFVSTKLDEVELIWDNLEKYTVENGVQKENVYEVKVKSKDIRGTIDNYGEYDYDVETTKNEIIITSNKDFVDIQRGITFLNFDYNDERPTFKVGLSFLGNALDDKYDKEVVTKRGEDHITVSWKDFPYYLIRYKQGLPGIHPIYGIYVKDESSIDKNKYKVNHLLDGNIIVTKLSAMGGEEVQIKDLEFKRLLINEMNQKNRYAIGYKEKDIDSPIYKHELEKLKTLGYEYDSDKINIKDIKNFEGLEYLTSLESIKLNAYNGEAIEELSKLKLLKKVEIEKIDSNEINNDVLGKLTNIESLKLWGRIDLENLGFLNTMKNLNSLEIAVKDIKNLDAIKDSNIKELSIEADNIHSITPIVENGKIEKLSIVLPGLENKIKGGTPDEKMKAVLDALIQMRTYHYTNGEMSREEIFKEIEDSYNGDKVALKEYIDKYLKEVDGVYSIKNLNEIVKLSHLKSLKLNGVKLESIEGISKLKELKNLDISKNFVSDLSEVLKMDTLEELIAPDVTMYDRRELKAISDKIKYSKLADINGHSKYRFLINPKKFTLPDIYQIDGKKFDIFDKENEIDVILGDGFLHTEYIVDLYKDMKNFIKKNEDGTYSYIYKPYEYLRISSRNHIEVELYPINSDYNEQDLGKNKIDKTKVVDFKDKKLKEIILDDLKSNLTYGYNKKADETDIYEDELKYIKNLSSNFEGVSDLSELSKFPNLNWLEINKPFDNLESLKDLNNLRGLTINALKKGQRLPKFNKDNNIWELKVTGEGTPGVYSKLEKEDLELLKKDIIENNLTNLRRLNVAEFLKISVNGLEELKNLNEYNGNNFYGANISPTNYSNEINIDYNNKKIVTDKSVDNFNKNSKEKVEITSTFKPKNKNFRINILDKVNNKNIEITDPALKKNEDGTYELVNYANKIQEIKFDIDGKKVILKIDTTNMPLTSEEENQRKEDEKVYTEADLLRLILSGDNNYEKVKKVDFIVHDKGEISNGEYDLSDFDILKNFKNIEELRIKKGTVGKLEFNRLNWDVIKGLKNLKNLNISRIYNSEYFNGKKEYEDDAFDISNIEGIKTLERLVINGSDYDNEYGYGSDIKLSNIEKLSTLNNLKILKLNTLGLKNIDFLSGLTKLEHLELMKNNLENVDALSELTELKTLIINENKLKNINGLRNKTKLIKLNLSKNQIEDINPLEKSVDLAELELSSNNIENADVLRNLKNLKLLEINKNSRISNLNGLKESLKENENSSISIVVGDNAISDSELGEISKVNERLFILGRSTNSIVIKPKTNKFDIDLLQNGEKLILSDTPFFRNSGLIKNEDGTYSFKDYKNSEIVRLNIGKLPEWLYGNYFIHSLDKLRPYYYVYIDPSDIREEDKVVPTPEKEEDKPMPKEENKVEKKVEDKISEINEKPELKIPYGLPYAGAENDSILKLSLVAVFMYTIISLKLYINNFKNKYKKNNNK